MTLKLVCGACLASASLLSLTACADTNRSYRVASVGSAGSFSADSTPGGSGGSTSSGGTSVGSSGGSTGTGSGSSQTGLIAATGNVLIGAATQYAGLSGTVNGLVPGSGILNGAVVGTLQSSGHTLVRLDTGTTVLLNGTGGGLGQLVSIDFGRGRVIGGPQPLVGVNVLAANPTSGSLATVTAASANKLVGVTVLNPTTGGGAPVLAPTVAPLLGLQPVNADLTTTVNAVVKGSVGGLLSK